MTDTKQNEWDLFLKNVSEVTGKDVKISFSVNGEQKDLGAIDTTALAEEMSGGFIAKMDLTINDTPGLVQRRSSTQTAATAATAAVAAADLRARSENTFIESLYIFLIIIVLTCFMLGIFYLGSFII